MKEVVNTRDIPDTYDILEKVLPQVLESTCFNDTNTPFYIEVRSTEIGHLFEHILLEYLCEEKLISGYSDACYQGFTDWNWSKNPRGTFHIVVNSGIREGKIFHDALEKTIILMNIIIRSAQRENMTFASLSFITEFIPQLPVNQQPITYLLPLN